MRIVSGRLARVFLFGPFRACGLLLAASHLAGEGSGEPKRNLPECRKCKKGIRGGGEKIARFFSGEHHYYIIEFARCKADY